MEVKNNYVIHNCHTHLFTIDYIPKYFLSRYFPTTWAKKKWVAQLGVLLFKNRINKYSAFFYSALKKNKGEVFNELKAYYPKSAKFCVLTVDFDYMQAGKPKYDFVRQVEDLAQLTKEVNKEGERIIPFLGIDPRRPDLLDMVKCCIEEKGYKGLKLYPGLGFFPHDKKLYPVYEYAEKYQIPITTHCIPKNKNHFRYRPTPEMIELAKTIKNYNDKYRSKPYHFAQYLNHPFWYSELLKDFPNLKINLAHFGGNEEWDKYLDLPNDDADRNDNWYSQIRQLLKDYPNVYSDISFTVYDNNLYPLLKNLINSVYKDPKIYSLREKILFGTDFYMLQKDYKERRFGMDLRGYLTEEEYWQITNINPRNFLKNEL